MNRYALSPKTMFIWRVRLILAGVVLAFLSGILAAFLPWAALAVAAAGLAAGVWAFFWYLPRLHKSYLLNISTEAVVLTRGVFVTRQYLMPCPRLIYAERFTTPLTAALGLCGLRLRASRGKLTIPPLSLADTADIMLYLGRDYLPHM